MPSAVDFLTGDTTRGPSRSIWGDIEVLDAYDDPGRGCYIWDDFMSIPITPPTTEGNWGNYAAFTSTGGTMADGSTLGGAVAIGSDGDDEGASFRTVVAPFKIARGQQPFAFEARIKTSTIGDTKHNILLGLIENAAFSATVPITAAGAIADKNMVGFRRTEAANGGATIDAVYKADGVTAVTQVSGLTTLVADTYVKLGMRYFPQDRGGTGENYVLAFYVNGVRSATYKQIPSAAGTDFPNDVNLGLFMAVLNATGTTPGTSTIDWWRAWQGFQP